MAIDLAGIGIRSLLKPLGLTIIRLFRADHMNPDQEERDHVLNIVNWYREAHHGFVEARRLDSKRGTIVRRMSVERVDDRKGR